MYPDVTFRTSTYILETDLTDLKQNRLLQPPLPWHSDYRRDRCCSFPLRPSRAEGGHNTPTFHLDQLCSTKSSAPVSLFVLSPKNVLPKSTMDTMPCGKTMYSVQYNIYIYNYIPSKPNSQEKAGCTKYPGFQIQNLVLVRPIEDISLTTVCLRVFTGCGRFFTGFLRVLDGVAKPGFG